MKIWICLWTIALLSIASASDLSANEGYSAVRHESDFYVDKITITNNLNASIQNITLKLPEDVQVFNFWQSVGDKYYLAWHDFLDNCTVVVKLEKPVEKVGILLMVYKREDTISGGAAATPDSVMWEGGQMSPPVCEPEQCPTVENQTIYVPVAQVRTEAPPFTSVLILLLLLVIIVMGVGLTWDQMRSMVGLPTDAEAQVLELMRINSTLEDSPVRSNVLSYIGEGHQTTSGLARAFRMTPRGMHKHLEKLESIGLVEREEAEGRKLKHYRLTEKGRRALKSG